MSDKHSHSGNLVVILLIITAVVTLSNLYTLNIPSHWDASTLIRGSLFLLNNFGTAFLCPQELELVAPIGHPPLLNVLFAGVWKIFGYSLPISHLVIIAFSVLCLFYTYRLSLIFMSGKYAAIATLLLFSSPLYVAQTGIIKREVALAAFSVMTLYYFIADKKILYLLSASMLVLTKSPGLLLIFSLLLYTLLTAEYGFLKELLKKLSFHSIPIIVFILWTIYHMALVGLAEGGTYMNAFYEFDFSFFNFIASFSNRVRQLFSNDHRYITTGIIVLYYLHRKLPGTIEKSYVLFPVGIAVSAAVYKLLNYSFGAFAFIFVFYIFIVKEVIKQQKLLMLFSILFLPVLIFFSIFLDLPRYILYLYPSYYLFSAWCLAGIKDIGKMSAWGITLVMLLLHLSSFQGDRLIISTGSGAYLESNLEYLDQIKTQKAACTFLERNYPGHTVLTNFFPLAEQLNFPELGYVQAPISHVLYPVDPETEYDLIYFSYQSHEAEEFKRFIESSNVKLLKEFSVRNKVSKIYKVIKE